MAIKTPEARYKVKADDESSAVIKKVQQNMQNLGSSAAILQGPLNGVSGRLTAIGAALGRVNPGMIGLGVAIAGVTAAMHASYGEAAELEKQQFRLEALLKSTGYASGFTANELDKLARRIGDATLASQSGARDAIGILLTFKSISGDAFERTIELGQDMAAVMGTDIKTATLQLAKALEDPVRGLNSLRRSGVSFTESEQEMIKSLAEAGKELESQSLILDKIGAQLGGAGAGEAAGLAGAADGVSERWKTLKQNLANVEEFTIATKAVSSLLDTFNNFLNPEDIDQAREASYRLFELEKEIAEYRNGSLGFRRFALIEERKQLQDLIVTLSEKRGLEAQEIKTAREKADQQKKARKEEIETLNELDASLEQYIADKQALEKEYKKQQKEIEKTKQKYDELWLKALPPLDRLAAAYNQDALFLAEALEKKVISQQQFNDALLLLDNNYRNQEYALRVEQANELNGAVEQAELEHQARMGDIVAQGYLERSRFIELTTRAQTKTVLDELVNLTAGVSTTNKKLFELNKVAAIASAIVNTHEGVTKTLAKYPQPLAGIMAAVHLAAGYAQVRAIRSTSYGSGGGGSTGIPSQAASPGLPVTPTTQPAQQEQAQATNQIFIITGGNADNVNYEEVANYISDRINNSGYVMIRHNTAQGAEIAKAAQSIAGQ